MRPVARLVLLLSLAACASPTTHYLTLSPAPPARPMAVVGGPPVELRHVSLPAMLDRLSLVERSGPNSLTISDQYRWAAPLDGMTQRVLAADLQARLPGFGPGPGDTRGIAVDISTFIREPDGRVLLQADWSLLAGAKASVVLQRRESITADSASGRPDAVAAAMSQALGVLSDRIAQALQGQGSALDPLGSADPSGVEGQSPSPV